MSELDPRRVGRITGSRVAGILGLSPYTTRADVLREMVRQHHGLPAEFQGNVATQWGVDHEADAVLAYERDKCVMTHSAQELVLHEDHDFLAVTPDGLVGDDGMIEVKCPYRGGYMVASERMDYVAQMQLQMAVAKRKWCDFVIWREGEQILIDRVAYDSDWLPSVLPTLQAFMADYAAALESPDEHLADKVADMGDNSEWRAWAAAYAVAKEAEAEAKAAADKAREGLIELAQATGCKNAKGCGWQVIRSERAGSVSYAKAVKELLPDADLSAYTGKPTTVFTVKESA